jgi:tetratricopeptide (TPR) repeat protein
MNDSTSISQSLRDIIKNRLSAEFDWDIVPVPAHGDKMVRLRTLEEALEEFEGEPDAQELQRYLIQIKPKRACEPQRSLSEEAEQEITISKPGAAGVQKHAPKGLNDTIFLPSGELNVEFLLKNAELLTASGDYALARNIYSRIAQAGQSGIKTSEALLGMAICFELENNLEGARDKYEESIAYHPTLETYQRLATLLLHQGKSYQAAETLERALHLKDLAPKTRYELHKASGNSWMRAGEMASAERNYKKALEVDPSADEIQANLGALYLHAEKIPEARRRFQDALAANPRNDKALAGMGSCLLSVGDKRGAHDHFARALEIEIRNPQTIFHLVKCAYELKSYATAARILEEYVQVAPINVNVLYSLAGLQFHLGRMNDSRGTCEKVLELSPTHAGAQELFGMMENF